LVDKSDPSFNQRQQQNNDLKTVPEASVNNLLKDSV
jgi:hypothetical protein